MPAKNIVIGLDGATFDLIKPWVKEGKLPNIAMMMRDGISSNLKSVHPPISPQAWASILTGKRPGKHGIGGWIQRSENNQWVFSNSNYIRTDTLWDNLTYYGKKSAFLFVPMTYPAKPLNGIMISGYCYAHNPINTYPAHLMDIMKNRFDIKYLFELRKYGPDDNKYLKELLKSIDEQASAIKHLIAEDDYDYFMVVFGQTDRGSHHLWKYMVIDPNENSEKNNLRNALMDVYIKIDKVLGELIMMQPDSNFIIISDHGMGPQSKMIDINRWLNSIGLLKYNEEGNYYNICNVLIKNISSSLKKIWPFKIVKKTIDRLIILPIKRYLGKAAHPHEFSSLKHLNIDMERTKMFNVSYGNLYFTNNVSKEERRPIIQNVISKLRGLKDPETGEPVIDKIYLKDEIFRGNYSMVFPEIYFTTKDEQCLIYSIDGKKTKNIFNKREEGDTFGGHRMNGIFIAFGKDIKKGGALDNAEIIDIAPTVLSLLDLPVPNDMDGKVLDIFNEKKQIKTTDRPIVINRPDENIKMEIDYSDEEAKGMVDQLKGLGYI
jgi:predicted AlkP superfamily phosphohydrolase/phosphomutase